MIVFLAVAALLVAAIALFMNRPEFGRAPRGERLERIWRSPNYRDGAFRNRHATPQLTSGKGWWATMYDFLFERKERNRPDHALPAVKTDLKALDPKENLLVWFGHSSYLIQADGLRILVDPVFETASPLPFFNRPFEGTDLYKPEDMPGIDLLVITHDHWDHLDYGTVTKLRDRTGRVVCPLGVGEYFEYWGFDPLQTSLKPRCSYLQRGFLFDLSYICHTGRTDDAFEAVCTYIMNRSNLSFQRRQSGISVSSRVKKAAVWSGCSR